MTEMYALFGPGPAQVTAPFCSARDLVACLATNRASLEVLSSSAVWRVMVAAHFMQPLEALGALLHPPVCPENMVAQLAVEPGGALRLYAALLRSGSGVLQGLSIDPRARLMFEIHELQEWDKRRQHFLMQRQAECAARALGENEIAVHLRQNIAENALELMSLITMVSRGCGVGGDPKLKLLKELSGMSQPTPAMEGKLRELVYRRKQKRMAWLQLQREYLLSEL